MIGSLYSGISGLKANTSAMAVIGDNIANVATTGFKSSSVSFANIFSSTLSRTGLEIGRGVTLEGINQRWDSGSLENTNSGTDLSVNGTGMFIVSDPTADSVFYTRAGQFEWDKDGYLVTQDGLIVQGYTLASDGSASGLGDLSLPNGTSAPNATQNLSFGINLDSDAAVGDTFISSITTYDSLGSEVLLDIEFTRAAAGWDWAVNVDPATANCYTTGHVEFDVDGNLVPGSSYYDPDGADLDGDGTDEAAVPGTNPLIEISGLNGASDMAITWTYLDAAGRMVTPRGYATKYELDSSD